jgi:hypothetical protein
MSTFILHTLVILGSWDFNIFTSQITFLCKPTLSSLLVWYMCGSFKSIYGICELMDNNTVGVTNKSLLEFYNDSTSFLTYISTCNVGRSKHDIRSQSKTRTKIFKIFNNEIFYRMCFSHKKCHFQIISHL